MRDSRCFDLPASPHGSAGWIARALRHVAWASIGAFASSVFAQAILLDRIAAVVNGRVITESDIRWYLALDPETPEGEYSEEVKSRALHQLIDQMLLYQEAEKLPTIAITEEEIERYLTELRARFSSERAFAQRLAAVGLDETTLRAIARHRVEILRFIDFRFRAFVFVSEPEVQWYYENRVIPEARRRGTTPPPLEQVRPLIEQILRNEKVKSEMIAWLDEARRTAEIILYPPYRSPTVPSAFSPK
ncbi:Chaperone SurA [bacterium HR08]|nr:Chaperone SurA [bacterium HR08]